jgi:hypothetical protein
MDLPNRCRSKGLLLKRLKAFPPILAHFWHHNLLQLTGRHAKGLVPGDFEGPFDLGRDQFIFLDAEHLGQLQGRTS